MRIWKRTVLFYLGGMLYTALELMWRGWSHGSMFLLGGLCFLMIGAMERTSLPLPARATLDAGMVTALELGCGLVVNRQFLVWDYRHLPLNFQGQICLPFTLLWIPVCLLGAFLYRRLDQAIGT